MTEERIIEQLKNLRKIRPRELNLIALKQEILRRISYEESFKESDKEPFPRRFILWFRSPAALTWSLAAIILLIGAFAFYEPINFKARSAIVQIRIASTSNKLEKARLAVNLARFKLQRIQTKERGISETNAEDIQSLTALAYTRLGELNLLGEKGQYTTEQCKELYLIYDEFLKELMIMAESETVKAENNPTLIEELEKLKRQIAEYEEEVDAKLDMY